MGGEGGGAMPAMEATMEASDRSMTRMTLSAHWKANRMRRGEEGEEERAEGAM